MSYSNRGNPGVGRQRFWASNNQNPGAGKHRKENIRFQVNKGKSSRHNLVIDEHIQEATPEHLRIEIDNIFEEFLADSEKSEHIFPADYNNLQRKYIHYKAQIMNLVSRSHGKEPNRQLYLKKKPRELTSQSFQVPLCDDVYYELQDFAKKYDDSWQTQLQNHRVIKCHEKSFCKIEDNVPMVPPRAKINNEVVNTRQSLPIFDKQETVINSINNNQVVIISSETGSGKTTQVPQYILEEAFFKNKPCKIICTQPRRISTIAAAERVAYERGEAVGSTIGYHIRLESKCNHNTNLMFCTVGVFLRNLMYRSKCLKNITHVIVDEIHERDKLSDFLLICLKQNLHKYPHLKVILMSATVDTTKFQEYFGSSGILSIPGRLYPIETYFLEDVLSMTRFFTPLMRTAMNKLQQKQAAIGSFEEVKTVELSEQDQYDLDSALEAYQNFSADYDYTVHYEEATADLLLLFTSEDVPVDQQHSKTGWTALMLACQLGDVEFVSKLCTIGANLDVADVLGRTAYDYAKLENKNNVLQLLKFIKEQNMTDKTSSNTNDSQYLRQLYDMTTPDDFIDYDLIVALVEYIHENSDTGSILIFLPGYDEIMRCNDKIVDSNLDSSVYRIFFLHSSMNMKDQCDVFKSLPNKRKLILSTNIAETSITVEDVVFVIDVGKAKEKVYDTYNKLSTLQTQWISRACAQQRQGRAGRVRQGFCFRLYSKQRYCHMSVERVPEILRVSLEELCLHAKIIAPRFMNIYNFLSLAPDPPTANAVGAAIEHLQSLGALDKEEDLTSLGEYLAQLTLEPRLGKMLIYGCIFKCLEPLLTLCATMAHKDPFQLPPQANLKTMAAERRRELLAGVPSDHAVYLLVFQRWQEETAKGRSKQFCHDYFISEATMYTVVDTRRQLLGQLRAVGFVSNNNSIDEYNVNSNSWGLVKAIMGSALFPNVAYPVQRGLSLATRNQKKVAVHNMSACTTKKYENWYFYDEMVKNRINFMIRGVTSCTPLMVALMCGVDTVYPSSHSVNIDDTLEFYFGDIAAITFRKAVESLVDKALSNPSYLAERSNWEVANMVSKTLRKIMDMSEENAQFVQPKNIGCRPKFLYKPVHEANAGAGNKTITRDKMGQRPGPNKYANGNADGMEHFKNGRTPKRYVPPHKRRGWPFDTTVAQSLSFDNFSPSTSTNTNLAHRFQELSVKPVSSNPSEALLNGLMSARNMNSQDYLNQSLIRRDDLARYNDGCTYYNTYNSQSGYFDGYNEFYYPDGHLQTHYNSGYGRPFSNSNGVSDLLYSEVESTANAPRKIVKTQDITDYNYRDVYSLPARPEDIFFDTGSLGCQSLSPTSFSVDNLFPENNYSGWLSIDMGSHQNERSTNFHTYNTAAKYCEHPDNPLFIFIKAREKRNIDIAQSCNKWVFSPQTEKKVLNYASEGKTIYLIFFVKELQMFMGIAEYISVDLGKKMTKPTAFINWMYVSPLPKNKTLHLRNPYHFGTPICDSQDGVIIQKTIGEELIRIYEELGETGKSKETTQM